MPNHLFLDTIYTQPLITMDLIQSYMNWIKQVPIYNRKVRENNLINNSIKDIIEEYYINNRYILTTRIILNPINPAIILLEELSFNYQTNIQYVKDLNDDTYLDKDKFIRIISGDFNQSKSNIKQYFLIRDDGPLTFPDIPESLGILFDNNFLSGGTQFDTWLFFDMSIIDSPERGLYMRITIDGSEYIIEVYHNIYKTLYATKTKGGSETYIALNNLKGYVPDFYEYITSYM